MVSDKYILHSLLMHKVNINNCNVMYKGALDDDVDSFVIYN